MPEPTTTAAGAVVSLGVVTITGSIFGLEYVALLFAFAGGLVSCMLLLPPKTAKELVVTLALSAVIGATFAPVGFAWAMDQAGWFSKVPAPIARYGLALVIGAVWQILLKVAIAFVHKRYGGEAA